MLGVVLLTFRVSFFEDLRGGIGPGDSVAYPSERSRAYKRGALRVAQCFMIVQLRPRAVLDRYGLW